MDVFLGTVIGFAAGAAMSIFFWPLIFLTLAVVWYCLDTTYSSSHSPSYGKGTLIYMLIGAFLFIHFFGQTGEVVKDGKTVEQVGFVLENFTLVNVGIFIGAYIGLSLVTVFGKFMMTSYRFREKLHRAKRSFLSEFNLLTVDKFVERYSETVARAKTVNEKEHDLLCTLHAKYKNFNPDDKLPADLTNLFTKHLQDSTAFQWSRSCAGKRIVKGADGVETTAVALDPNQLPLWTWATFWPVYSVEFLYRPVIQLWKWAVSKLKVVLSRISLRFSSANI